MGAAPGTASYQPPTDGHRRAKAAELRRGERPRNHTTGTIPTAAARTSLATRLQSRVTPWVMDATTASTTAAAVTRPARRAAHPARCSHRVGCRGAQRQGAAPRTSRGSAGGAGSPATPGTLGTACAKPRVSARPGWLAPACGTAQWSAAGRAASSARGRRGGPARQPAASAARLG